jgi:hypothetical protein
MLIKKKTKKIFTSGGRVDDIKILKKFLDETTEAHKAKFAIIEFKDDFDFKDIDNTELDSQIQTSENMNELVKVFIVTHDYTEYNKEIDKKTAKIIKEYCEVTKGKCENYYLRKGIANKEDPEFVEVNSWIDILIEERKTFKKGL